MKIALGFALSTAILLTVATASADGSWSHTTEFKYKGAASIKIVEPAGYTVIVNGQQDTAPAVFNLPNQDQYYPVKVVSKKGETWNTKVEVRMRQQTVLRVSHKAKVAAKAKIRDYIGTMKNTTNKCPRSHRFVIKYELQYEGNDAGQQVLKAGERANNVKLPGGNYSIRVYHGRNGKFRYKKTLEKTLNKDGWVLSYGC